MTKIIIISGFLGSGKTTFINKFIKSLKGKVVIVENEFGDVSIDSKLIDEDVPVSEIYSGCVCCSLKGELKSGILGLLYDYNPDYILIEPSGVGKLSEVMKVCYELEDEGEDVKLTHRITMVEGEAYDEYVDDFGSFFTDQIYFASHIFITMTENLKENELESLVKRIREENLKAAILTEDFRTLDNEEISEILNISEDESFSIEDLRKDLQNYSVENKVFKSYYFKDLSFESLDELNDKLQKLIKENTKLTKESGHILRIKGTVKLKSGKRILVNSTRYKNSLEYVDGKNPFDDGEEDALIFIGSSLDKDRIRRVLTFRKLTLKN